MEICWRARHEKSAGHVQKRRAFFSLARTSVADSAVDRHIGHHAVQVVGRRSLRLNGGGRRDGEQHDEGKNRRATHDGLESAEKSRVVQFRLKRE